MTYTVTTTTVTSDGPAAELVPDLARLAVLGISAITTYNETVICTALLPDGRRIFQTGFSEAEALRRLADQAAGAVAPAGESTTGPATRTSSAESTETGGNVTGWPFPQVGES